MDIADTVPMTVWEQAGVVVLFALILFGLVTFMLSWFTKLQRLWQDSNREVNDNWQTTTNRLFTQLNATIDAQSQRECETLDKVSISLDRLTDRIQDQHEFMVKHDEKVDKTFERAFTELQKSKRKTDPKL